MDGDGWDLLAVEGGWLAGDVFGFAEDVEEKFGD